MKNSAGGDDDDTRADGRAIGASRPAMSCGLSALQARRGNGERQLDEDSEKGSSPEIPNPGRITDRVDGIGGVELGAADPFASDGLRVSRANPKITPSLSDPATS